MTMGTGVTETKAWRALQAHYAEVEDVHLRDLCANDPGRDQRFSAEGAGAEGTGPSLAVRHPARQGPRST